MSGTVIGILCVAVFLLIIGIVLCTGHGSWLIAGFNTMKPEEQAKYVFTYTDDEIDAARYTSMINYFLLDGGQTFYIYNWC